MDKETLREDFICNGWSGNIDFTEVTLEEAQKKGWTHIESEMKNGKSFFRMDGTINIYDENGKLAMTELLTIHEHSIFEQLAAFETEVVNRGYVTASIVKDYFGKYDAYDVLKAINKKFEDDKRNIGDNPIFTSIKVDYLDTYNPRYFESIISEHPLSFDVREEYRLFREKVLVSGFAVGIPYELGKALQKYMEKCWNGQNADLGLIIDTFMDFSPEQQMVMLNAAEARYDEMIKNKVSEDKIALFVIAFSKYNPAYREIGLSPEVLEKLEQLSDKVEIEAKVSYNRGLRIEKVISTYKTMDTEAWFRDAGTTMSEKASNMSWDIMSLGKIDGSYDSISEAVRQGKLKEIFTEPEMAVVREAILVSAYDAPNIYFKALNLQRGDNEKKYAYGNFATELHSCSKAEILLILHNLKEDVPFEDVKAVYPYIETAIGNHPNYTVRAELAKLKEYVEKEPEQIKEKNKKKDKGVDIT